MALSNFDVNALVKELQILKGAYLNNFQLIGRNIFKLKLGKHSLVIAPPGTMHLTEYSLQAEVPSSQVMHVRKRLKNSRLDAIEQMGFDRVVSLGFSNGFRLFIELFGEGNIVLVDSEGNTSWAMRYESWKDREIKPKRAYKCPASRGLDPSKMDFTEFEAVFTEKDVIRGLVKGVNLAPEILEEACFRAGIDKNAEKCDKNALFGSIKQILEQPLGPGIQGKPVPIKLLSRGEEFKPMPSFNKALDSGPPVADKPAGRSRADTIRHRLEEQHAALGRLDAESRECKAVGDAIYSRMAELNKKIEKAKSMLKEKRPWKEIESGLGCKATPKTKTIEIGMD